MKLVTLTKDMRPWRQGDRVILPDDVADRVLENGECKDPEPWGAEPAKPTAVERVRETLRLPPKGRYITKGSRR